MKKIKYNTWICLLGKESILFKNEEHGKKLNTSFEIELEWIPGKILEDTMSIL